MKTFLTIPTVLAAGTDRNGISENEKIVKAVVDPGLIAYYFEARRGGVIIGFANGVELYCMLDKADFEKLLREFYSQTKQKVKQAAPLFLFDVDFEKKSS